VTDDITDWPLPNEILGCATAYKASLMKLYFFFRPKTELFSVNTNLDMVYAGKHIYRCLP